MAKRPTEEELGIHATTDEITTQNARPVDDDAMPLVDDDAQQEAAPADAMTDQEKAEGRVRGPDGKFVPKKVDAAAEGADVTSPGDPAQPAKPNAPGLVDVRALQEARAENKVLMQRMTTLLELTQRREAKAEQALQPKPEAPVVPDKLVDPLGHYDHKVESLEQRVARFEQAEQQAAQQREAQAREEEEMQQVFTTAKPQFDEAAAADPTIMPVYDALLKNMTAEFAFVNGGRFDANGNLSFVNGANAEFQRDPRGFLQREMTKMEASHVRYALQTGQHPAIYMRDLAASRGVRAQPPAPAPQPAPQPTAAAPAAQQAQPAAAAPPPVSIAERQQQQQRHMSLTDAPGGQPEGKVDAKTIARMSNKEFADFAKNMKEADLDAMMGGRA